LGKGLFLLYIIQHLIYFLKIICAEKLNRYRIRYDVDAGTLTPALVSKDESFEGIFT